MSGERLPITPRTKVGDLLNAYPELEDVLISIAPAFKKLRNPVLRRTVARMTSLAQAARVGGVSVTEIVQQLRKAAGQPQWEGEAEGVSAVSAGGEPPDWVKAESIEKTFDARSMIEAGEQPLTAVMHDLSRLPDGAVYELITPFEPAPLIDRAKEKGFAVYAAARSASEFRTYFKRDAR